MKTIGKTIGRTSGCRDIHREIEEAGQADSLSLVANDHLKHCAACETFYREQFKLRQIVSSLGTVAAPGDFDFRLRARLAGEKRGAAQAFALGNFSFGFRSAAVAAVLLLIGSALLFVSLRPSANSSFVADKSANEAKANASQPRNTAPSSAPRKNDVKDPAPRVAVGPLTDQSNVVDASLNPGGLRGRARRAGRGGLGSMEVASVAAAGNDRVKTRDIGSTQAKVFRPEDFVAAAGHSVFPIEGSPQSLKVSLDNGRGSSKTISLPGVSFGSQRVLTQSASPLLASERGAW